MSISIRPLTKNQINAVNEQGLNPHHGCKFGLYIDDDLKLTTEKAEECVAVRAHIEKNGNFAANDGVA